MPEYLAPAVFVEETSFRAKSIEGVGTSTAAFVGMTSRGPVSVEPDDPTPPLLTSYGDFERYYGSADDLVIGNPAKAQPNYLALAAQAFFNNGGGRLYVARILGTGAKAAGPENAGDDNKVRFSARQMGGATIPGSGDENYRVEIARSELESTNQLARKQPAGTTIVVGNAYKVVGTDSITDNDTGVSIISYGVTVHGPDGPIFEAAGLGIDPNHPRYIGTVMAEDPPDAAAKMTNPVAITIAAGVKAKDLDEALQKGLASGVRSIALKGGLDGTGAPKADDYKTALDSLLALEDISIIAAPDSQTFGSDTLARAVNGHLITNAEQRRSYRMAVLDTPPGLDIAGARGLKSKLDSKYAAIYYPWVTISNPLSGEDPRQPAEVNVPPSGSVCGIYARSDVQRGVWKAPANETVAGALGLQREVRFGEQEVLNPLGVNCIRSLPNRGIRVWGARTLSSDPEWKYVNIRRYFLYLENSIDRGTQWAVFEPNGEALWSNVRTTVTDFLYNEWVSGALLGTKPEEAFFVRCDRSTMTQNDLDNGRLICLIGVAAIKPAEFVIFRIGQKTADARG
jgi:phage tail sheath protein FI